MIALVISDIIIKDKGTPFIDTCEMRKEKTMWQKHALATQFIKSLTLF